MDITGLNHGNQEKVSKNHIQDVAQITDETMEPNDTLQEQEVQDGSEGSIFSSENNTTKSENYLALTNEKNDSSPVETESKSFGDMVRDKAQELLQYTDEKIENVKSYLRDDENDDENDDNKEDEDTNTVVLDSLNEGLESISQSDIEVIDGSINEEEDEVIADRKDTGFLSKIIRHTPFGKDKIYIGKADDVYDEIGIDKKENKRNTNWDKNIDIKTGAYNADVTLNKETKLNGSLYINHNSPIGTEGELTITLSDGSKITNDLVTTQNNTDLQTQQTPDNQARGNYILNDIQNG